MCHIIPAGNREKTSLQVRSRTPHMPQQASASVPSVVALFTTCYRISHDTCRPCLSKPQHRLSVSFGRVSLQAPPSRHAPSSAHCRTQNPCAFAKNPENRPPQKTPPQTPEQRCRRKVNTVSTGTQHPVVPKSAQKTRKNPREPLPAITINTS